LLLENKRPEYAELTTDTVAPLLFKLVKDQPAGAPTDADRWVHMMTQIGGPLAVLPLSAPSFLKGMPEKDVRALIGGWQKLRDKTETDEGRRLSDQVLWAAYDRLGMDEERREVARRLGSGLAGKSILSSDNADKEMDQCRNWLRTWSQRR
jgi:hypothetical protein